MAGNIMVTGMPKAQDPISAFLGGTVPSSGGSINFSGATGGVDTSALTSMLTGGGVPATTQNQSTTGTQKTKKASQTNTAQSTTGKQTGTVATQQQNMSAEALAALNDIVSGRSTDPLLGAKDQASQANIAYLESLMAGLNPQDAEQRASGRTAQLSRQLTEEVLPGLFGRTEAAGFGTSALSSLLAQDAAVRTAEAQNRAVEEAYFNTINAGNQAAQTMGQLTTGTSASSAAMLEALGISKGAVQSGLETRDLTNTEVSTGTSTTTETGSADTAESGTSSTVDPLGWANMLAGLLNTQMQLNTGPTKKEKDLATFMAAGGDLFALQQPGFHDYGYSQSNKDLASSLGLRL